MNALLLSMTCGLLRKPTQHVGEMRLSSNRLFEQLAKRAPLRSESPVTSNRRAAIAVRHNA